MAGTGHLVTQRFPDSIALISCGQIATPFSWYAELVLVAIKLSFFLSLLMVADESLLLVYLLWETYLWCELAIAVFAPRCLAKGNGTTTNVAMGTFSFRVVFVNVDRVQRTDV
jgi:hypothetical protein